MTAKTVVSRTVAAAAMASLVIGSAGAASAQVYRQPTGGGLSSVVSCDAPGGRQATGAVIGALLGAALGSNLSKDNRSAGTAIGALAGAAGGSYLGCKQQRDRQVAPQAAYNGGYAPARYTRAYDRSAAGAYVATSTLNVRAAPSTSAARVGTLGAGQQFQAVGRDGSWIVVSNGSSVGYVSGAYVQPANSYEPDRYQQASYGY